MLWRFIVIGGGNSSLCHRQHNFKVFLFSISGFVHSCRAVESGCWRRCCCRGWWSGARLDGLRPAVVNGLFMFLHLTIIVKLVDICIELIALGDLLGDYRTDVTALWTPINLSLIPTPIWASSGRWVTYVYDIFKKIYWKTIYVNMILEGIPLKIIRVFFFC